MNPVDLKYSKAHEYIKAEGNIVILGITHHAQESLGDVVFVELPDEGAIVTAGKNYGTVESVKSVSDLTSSVSGKVVEVNSLVLDAPELLNSDPYGQGWLIKVQTDDLSPLEAMMSAGEYEAFLTEEER